MTRLECELREGIGVDRIMFGTDYLQPGQPVPQFELFDALKLPAAVEAKIFRKNAETVLKLS